MKKKSEKPVNVYSDAEMNEAGFFRGAEILKYDFSKSKKEKKILRKMKYKIRDFDGHVYSTIKPYSSCKNAKIIIQLVKNKIFDKTTYSKICRYNDIPVILAKYSDPKTGKTFISKYKYNTRWYNVQEMPYCC